MATVDKAFRIKNGLVVEGSSATVNGSNVLTEASTEFLQDTTAGMFDGPQSGITFSYNDGTGKITATVDTTPTFTDRIIFEGAVPDAYELTLLAPEPVADVTVTLQIHLQTKLLILVTQETSSKFRIIQLVLIQDLVTLLFYKIHQLFLAHLLILHLILMDQQLDIQQLLQQAQQVEPLLFLLLQAQLSRRLIAAQ
jgi:hypothetical protein